VTSAPDPARTPDLLLDTHVLVWLMFGERRLGPRARQAIHQACGDDSVLVSAITPWEIALLASKNRIELCRDVLDWVRSALAVPGVRLTPLTPEIAVASTRLPWEMHAGPADRILAATARQLGATLVTADESMLGFAANGFFAGMDARV